MQTKGLALSPGLGQGGWEGSWGAAPLPEAGGEDCTQETGGRCGGVQPSASGLSAPGGDTQPSATTGRRPFEAPRRPRLEQALSVYVWKVQALSLSSPRTAMMWVPCACAWQLVRARGVGLHQEGQFSWEKGNIAGQGTADKPGDPASPWRLALHLEQDAPSGHTRGVCIQYKKHLFPDSPKHTNSPGHLYLLRCVAASTPRLLEKYGISGKRYEDRVSLC